MADNLPPSLITEILSKLPAKSLLRFRCVSKQWKSTIDDPHFIKLHLKHSLHTITNHSIILLRGSVLYSLDFPALKNVTKINHPFQNDNPSLAVSGSCNGLLFLVDRNVEQHPIIYNPTTQQTRKVPSSKIELPFIEVKDFPFEELLVYGFGYDQVNDDYKLLRIAQVVLVSAHKFYDDVKVYSLKTNSWTRVKGLCDEYVRFMSRHCGVYVNGCLHWIVAKNPVIDEIDSLLVAFDLGSCKWKYVEQPKYSEARFGGCWTAVGVLGGCLSVACNYPKDRSEVWVMKEYGVEKSWTKILTLSKTMIRGSVNRVLPIAYSKDRSKVLIVQEDRLKLFWFNLQRQTIESVKIPRVAKIFVMVSGMLVESLVSLRTEEETKPKGKSGKLDGFLSKGFKLKL